MILIIYKLYFFPFIIINSYGYFIPSLPSEGTFLRIALELPILPRAQISIGQEYSDFYTPLGIGAYEGQITALPLLDIDKDLSGFEGGFTASVPKTSTTFYRYGYLIPYYNGKKFFGKVIRINLHLLSHNITTCIKSTRIEYYDKINNKIVTNGINSRDACVVILDLESLHPKAVGFRKGFTGKYPYGYLSPGEYSIAVRLNLELFSIQSTNIIELSKVDIKLFREK